MDAFVIVRLSRPTHQKLLMKRAFSTGGCVRWDRKDEIHTYMM
jgi:hypothetical protein